MIGRGEMMMKDIKPSWTEYLEIVVGCVACPITGNRPCDDGYPCDECSHSTPSYNQWVTNLETNKKAKGLYDIIESKELEGREYHLATEKGCSQYLLLDEDYDVLHMSDLGRLFNVWIEYQTELWGRE